METNVQKAAIAEFFGTFVLVFIGAATDNYLRAFDITLAVTAGT